MFNVKIHYQCVHIPNVIDTTVVCVESPRTGKFVVVEYTYIPANIKKHIERVCKVPKDCGACKATRLGRTLDVQMDLIDLKNMYTKRIYSHSVLIELGLYEHPQLVK